MWDKISVITAIGSCAISLVALIVAMIGSKTSAKIAGEALETARSAN